MDSTRRQIVKSTAGPCIEYIQFPLKHVKENLKGRRLRAQPCKEKTDLARGAREIVERGKSKVRTARRGLGHYKQDGNHDKRSIAERMRQLAQNMGLP